MDAVVPVTFTTYDVTMSHARKVGGRYTLCGVYVRMSFDVAETLLPKFPLCKVCEKQLLLMDEKE